MLLLLLVLVLLVGSDWAWLRGCSPSAPIATRGESKPNDPVIEEPVITVLAPLTGPFQETGQMLRRGAELAWDELQQGGLKGQLKVIDGEGDATTIDGLLTLAVDDPDNLVVLASLPQAVLTRMLPVFEQNRLPLLIVDGSHQSYCCHDWVFPLAGTDLKEAAFAARAAARIAAGQPIGLVHRAGAYGDLLKSGFVAAAKRDRMKIKRFQAGTDPAALSRCVAEVLAARVGVVYLAGPPQWGAAVTAAIREA